MVAMPLRLFVALLGQVLINVPLPKQADGRETSRQEGNEPTGGERAATSQDEAPRGCCGPRDPIQTRQILDKFFKLRWRFS